MGHIAYIGIGSNVGDKIDQCKRAISEILKVDRHTLLAQSSFFKTNPVGPISQDWFVNGVIKIETELDPLALLHSLKTIESQMGRRDRGRWGPREIDLDILFFDELAIETGGLQIPHPRIQERQFILAPLAEIDRDLLHPVLRKTVRELLESLQEDQGVQKL